MPQFSPDYWAKVPREKEKVKLTRIIKADDEFTEYTFDNGNAFQRRTEQLNDEIKLHVNLVVYVETINNEIVTGMWVPEQGWVFRMSNEELAEYFEKLITARHAQHQAAKADLQEFIALAIEEGLKTLCDVCMVAEDSIDVTGPFSPKELASYVMNAMEQAKSAGGR
jgi:hypothetical protein